MDSLHLCKHYSISILYFLIRFFNLNVSSIHNIRMAVFSSLLKKIMMRCTDSQHPVYFIQITDANMKKSFKSDFPFQFACVNKSTTHFTQDNGSAISLSEKCSPRYVPLQRNVLNDLQTVCTFNVKILTKKISSSQVPIVGSLSTIGSNAI